MALRLSDLVREFYPQANEVSTAKRFFFQWHRARSAQEVMFSRCSGGKSATIPGRAARSYRSMSPSPHRIVHGWSSAIKIDALETLLVTTTISGVGAS